MTDIVIITEKREQAERISNAMKWTKEKGYFAGHLGSKTIKMVYARGHLLTLKTPDEINPSLGWDNPSNLLPIPIDFSLKVCDDLPNTHPSAQPGKYLQNIEFHLKGVKEVVIATDSDREGEAIGWNILEYINFHGSVKRAWLSAGLDKKSITDAFENLRPPNKTKGWFRASEARSRADRSSMYVVRAYTHLASFGLLGSNLGRGHNRRSRVMSVGRVQTSALSMLVKREQQISSFVPIDHFKVSAAFLHSSSVIESKYSPLILESIIESDPQGVVWQESNIVQQEGKEQLLSSPLFVDKKRVDDFCDRIKESSNKGSILSVNNTVRKEYPPKTYSLTDAQEHIGTKLKISALLVQEILEDIRSQGYISYVRTSKSDLPSNIYLDEERNSLFDALSNISNIQYDLDLARKIHNGDHPVIKKFTPKVFTDKDMEHHGIMPTHQTIDDSKIKQLKPSNKSGGASKFTANQLKDVYMLVLQRFVQSFLPPAEYDVIDVTISVPTEDLLGQSTSIFKSKFELISNLGWRESSVEKIDESKSLPTIAEADEVTLKNIEAKPSKTEPSQRYTESSLPKAMENIGKEISDPVKRQRLKDSEGIGTPATRPTIINTLIARGYVETKKSTYHATKKGIDLIEHVPTWLKTPETTALWEDFLLKICNEQDDTKAKELRDVFAIKQIEKMNELIQSLIDTHITEGVEKLSQSNTPQKVSTKMKSAIKGIAAAKDVSIPKGALSDPEKASNFLNEHSNKSTDDLPTESSSAQLEYAKKILSSLPDSIKIDLETLKDRKECSIFIDKYRKHLPPTDAQKSYAENLYNNMPENERPDKSVLNTATSCSKFINAAKKKLTKKRK